MESIQKMKANTVKLNVISLLSSILSLVLMIVAGVAFTKIGIYSSISGYFDRIFDMFYFFIENLGALNAKRIIIIAIYIAFGIVLPFISLILSAQAVQKNNKSKLAITSLSVSALVILFYLYNLIK